MLRRFFDIRKSIEERGKFKTALRLGLIIFLISSIIGVSAAAGVYLYITSSLPKLDTLRDYRPNVVSTVYSEDGKILSEFFLEKRVLVPYQKFNPVLIDAFISAEDSRYFEHKGINFVAILRATLKNIEAGGVVQGGSTITQQVAKSLLLTPERSLVRKMREAILAYRMEKKFSKEDILSLYLNQIYLGEGAYGVEAASQTYFGKHVEDLTLPEASMLAGLPSSPSRLSPISHYERAKERQAYVLQRMTEDGHITEEERKAAFEAGLNLRKKEDLNKPLAPYFTEHIRRYIAEKYGDQTLYQGGLKIYTRLDVKMQEAAEKAVVEGLKVIDRRQGYRGPLKKLSVGEEVEFLQKQEESLKKRPLDVGKNVEGVIERVDNKGKYITVRMGGIKGRLDFADMPWAEQYPFKAGDLLLLRVISINPKTFEVKVALDQDPEIQGGLVAIDPHTGYVKAMVGGYDYSKTEFNRAVQSKRQPGSAFKPLLFAAALEKGYTPATIIVDSPVIFEETMKGSAWKPRNFDAAFYGPTTFRDALVHSRNVISIKILDDIGIGYFLDYAEMLGIRSPLARDLSVALGSSGVSLLEITGAYGVFATQGERAEPIFVTKIVDRDGNLLEENYPLIVKVMDDSTAYIMKNLMEGVVQYGTGQAVKALGRPAAGKTGTTNDLSDAWFIGFTPDLVAGVWVGHDELKPLGPKETGGRAAAPIWLNFMKAAVEGTPVKGFLIPEDVVFVKIDKQTGLLATPKSRETVFECFREGSEPTVYAPSGPVTTDFYRMEGLGDSEAGLMEKPPEHEME